MSDRVSEEGRLGEGVDRVSRPRPDVLLRMHVLVVCHLLRLHLQGMSDEAAADCHR